MILVVTKPSPRPLLWSCSQAPICWASRRTTRASPQRSHFKMGSVRRFLFVSRGNLAESAAQRTAEAEVGIQRWRRTSLLLGSCSKIFARSSSIMNATGLVCYFLVGFGVMVEFAVQGGPRSAFVSVRGPAGLRASFALLFRACRPPRRTCFACLPWLTVDPGRLWRHRSLMLSFWSQPDRVQRSYWYVARQIRYVSSSLGRMALASFRLSARRASRSSSRRSRKSSVCFETSGCRRPVRMKTPT